MRPTQAGAASAVVRRARTSVRPAHARRVENDPLALVLALVMAGTCVYAMRRADADLWGYLSYGRLFVEMGGPVEWDPFSYTCESCTWIAFEYLAQMSLWLAYLAGGPHGLIGLKCVLGGIAVCLVLRTVRSLDQRPKIWLPIYLFMLGVVPRYFLFRPQLYTFAFFAFFVDILIGYLAGRRTRLWLLVPSTAIWANLHGGFLAGLGVLGVTLMLRIAQHLNRGSSVRAAVRAAGGLCITLVAAIAASFVNPQGWRLWRYLFTELGHDMNRRYLQEWMPPSFARDPLSASSAILLLVALLTVGAVAWHRRSVRLDLHPWQWLVASVPLAALTALSVRHLPILVIWISPVLVVLAGGLPSRPEQRLRRVWAALSLCLALPAVFTLAVVIHHPAADIRIPEGTLGDTEPFGAVDFIKTNGLAGNLYVPLWWGSYATWELYPRIRVAVDGRNMSLYPPEMVRGNLEFYLRGDHDLDRPLRCDSHYLLVPSNAPVLTRLRADGRWRSIFEDPDCVLFVRMDVVSERLPRELVERPAVRATKWRRPRVATVRADGSARNVSHGLQLNPSPLLWRPREHWR